MRRITLFLVGTCLLAALAAPLSASAEKYGTGSSSYGAGAKYRTGTRESVFFRTNGANVFGVRRMDNYNSESVYGVRKRSLHRLLNSSGPAGERRLLRYNNSQLRRSILGSSGSMFGASRIRR